MILSAQSIQRRQGMITPFEARTHHEPSGCSFGLSSCGYDVRLDQAIVLRPGAFHLASTLEHFDIPADLVGTVHDKSTWARHGLAVQNTVIEPGWRGWLTLEITNHSKRMFHLLAGTPIAQILFHKLDTPTMMPYNGKYQDQERGAQQPR